MTFLRDEWDTGVVDHFSFPSLTSLSTNWMKYPFSKLSALTRLFICDGPLRGIEGEARVSCRVDDLFKALHGHAALKELHVELDSVHFNTRKDPPPAKLPSLKTLSLSVREYEAYSSDEKPLYQCLLWFTNHLSPPNLTTAHFQVVFKGMSESVWGFSPRERSFTSISPLTKVKTLTFEARVLDALLFEADSASYRESSLQHTQTVFDRFASSMPNVEDLGLVCPGLCPAIDSVPRAFRKLRSMHVEGWVDEPSARIAAFGLMNQRNRGALQDITLVSQSAASCSSEIDESRKAAPRVVILERNTEGGKFTWSHDFGYVDRAEKVMRYESGHCC